MNSQVEVKFSFYYDSWLSLLQTHLHQLLTLPRGPSHEQEQKAMVAKALLLYKEYYTMKWGGATADTLGFFSAPWLTPLERTHEWMTGWKPSSAFKIIDSLKSSGAQVKGLELPLTSLACLSEKQMKTLEVLKVQTFVQEQKVESQMERYQMSLAEGKTSAIARMSGNTTGVVEMDATIAAMVRGEGGLKRATDGLVDGLVGGMEQLMKGADCVRLTTMKGILDVLTPLQSVDYIIGLMMVQIHLRNWGKRREIVSAMLVA